MLLKILFWYLTKPREVFFYFSFFQFSLICHFFLFFQIEFLFPLFIIRNSFGDTFITASCGFFWVLSQRYPAPGSPPVLCVNRETAKSSAPGGCLRTVPPRVSCHLGSSYPWDPRGGDWAVRNESDLQMLSWHGLSVGVWGRHLSPSGPVEK